MTTRPSELLQAPAAPAPRRLPVQPRVPGDRLRDRHPQLGGGQQRGHQPGLQRWQSGAGWRHRPRGLHGGGGGDPDHLAADLGHWGRQLRWNKNKTYLKRPITQTSMAATNHHRSVIIDSYNLRACRWPHTHHQAEKRVAVLLKNISYGQSSAKLPVIMSLWPTCHHYFQDCTKRTTLGLPGFLRILDDFCFLPIEPWWARNV